MTAPLLCADRCAAMQAMALRLAAATGSPLPVVRLSAGMSREYVPLASSAHPCTACTDIHTSPLAAAECCDTPRGHL